MLLRCAIPLLTVGLLTFTGCRPQAAPVPEPVPPKPKAPPPTTLIEGMVPREDLVTIAVIGSNSDATCQAIHQLLGAHQVRCYVEGSVAYGVEVSKHDAAKARRLLREDKAISAGILRWVDRDP